MHELVWPTAVPKNPVCVVSSGQSLLCVQVASSEAFSNWKVLISTRWLLNYTCSICSGALADCRGVNGSLVGAWQGPGDLGRREGCIGERKLVLVVNCL